ncbi:hypothetical protein MPH_12225, partial [Macrophomina phaseolina MS6]
SAFTHLNLRRKRFFLPFLLGPSFEKFLKALLRLNKRNLIPTTSSYISINIPPSLLLPDLPGFPDELLATPRPPIPPTPIVINTPGTRITTKVKIEDENLFIIPTTRKRGPETFIT